MFCLGEIPETLAPPGSVVDNRHMTPMHPWRPWIMWGTGAAFFYFAFFQRTATSVMVPELMRDFGVTAAALGNLSAFYFWSYTAMQLPTGIMADRWGPRRLLACAAAISGIGTLMFANADSVAMAAMGRLLVGASVGFAFVCTLKIATDWFPAHRMGLLSGLLMMAGMLGGVSGQGPLAIAVQSYGWRTSMSAGAGLALVLALAAWFIVREHHKSDQASTERTGSGSALASLRRALGRRQTWLIAGFGFFLLPPMFAFGALWGVPYLSQVHGFERTEAAFAASLILLGWGICAPFVGWLSDRLRRRKLPMIIAASLNAVCMASLFYIPDPSKFAIHVILLANGVATAGMVGCFVMAREHNATEDAGSAMAFVNMAVIGCGAFFQPITGWLLDKGWRGEMADGARIYSEAAYLGAFWIIPASCTVAALLAMMTHETYAKAQVD